MGTYKDWYHRPEVKSDISAKRKKRYREDAAYREGILKRSEDRRKEKKIKAIISKVPDNFDHTLVEAAELVGMSPSTVREWISKGYTPKPAMYKRRFVFTLSQINLMGKIRDYLAVKGSKTGVHAPEFEDLKAFIAVNWD